MQSPGIGGVFQLLADDERFDRCRIGLYRPAGVRDLKIVVEIEGMEVGLVTELDGFAAQHGLSSKIVGSEVHLSE